MTSSVVDLADLRARDHHVLAGDRERGVVEDRADLVVAAVVAARAHADDERDQHAHDGERAIRTAASTRLPHGPTGLLARVAVVGGQLAVVGNGFEPSGAGCVAAPGQKRLPPRS